MKKILALGMVIAVVLSMGITAFANGNGSFVISPSANGAPVLMEDQSSANIKIVAYRDRHDELSDDHVDHFEDAYDSIASMSKMADAVPELSEIAESVNVKLEDLAVSDLFFVALDDGAEHPADEKFNVKFQAKTLGNYVCLLHFYDGIWHIVPNTELLGTDMLAFEADNLGPYAIVVSTGDAPVYPEAPGPDNTTSPWLIVGIVTAVLAAGAGASLIIIVIVKKKRKDEEGK